MTTLTHPITIKIDSDTNERVNRLAKTRNRTPHWMMREAIREFVVREEKREQFQQDGVNAWKEYQATGLHATAEEVDAWLAKLEAGMDDEPPVCHV
jgi:predicted transcriptional regulator